MKPTIVTITLAAASPWLTHALPFSGEPNKTVLFWPSPNHTLAGHHSHPGPVTARFNASLLNISLPHNTSFLPYLAALSAVSQQEAPPSSSWSAFVYIVKRWLVTGRPAPPNWPKAAGTHNTSFPHEIPHNTSFSHIVPRNASVSNGTSHNTSSLLGLPLWAIPFLAPPANTTSFDIFLLVMKLYVLTARRPPPADLLPTLAAEYNTSFYNTSSRALPVLLPNATLTQWLDAINNRHRNSSLHHHHHHRSSNTSSSSHSRELRLPVLPPNATLTQWLDAIFNRHRNSSLHHHHHSNTSSSPFLESLSADWKEEDLGDFVLSPGGAPEYEEPTPEAVLSARGAAAVPPPLAPRNRTLREHMNHEDLPECYKKCFRENDGHAWIALDTA